MARFSMKRIREIKMPGWLRRLSPKSRRFLWLSVSLAVVTLVIAYARGLVLGGSRQTPEYIEYQVRRGNVVASISGSGTVKPIQQYEIVATVSGEVLEDTFEEGDEVQKGQLLYTIDSSEMEKTLEKADISLERARMSYESTLKSFEGLTVRAPFSGRITEVLVEAGDNVQSGTRVATIVDDSFLTARVPFAVNDAQSLYVGQAATLTLENTFETLPAAIAKVYSSKRVVDGSVTVIDVEVSVENPGALNAGTYVTAAVGGIACYKPGILRYADEEYVISEGSGTVDTIIAPGGSYVSQGDPILTMKNSNAENTLRSSQMSLREAELSYASTLEQLDRYKITSPISGSIISKAVKEGDIIDSGSGNTVMAVIADMSTMIFEIDVDELDIASMREGQRVNITSDALSDKTFTGHVSNIGLLGTSSNGVTTYPMTIVIDEPQGLWPGMNVTADIIVDSAENVLTVPIAAVSRGNLVLVKESDAPSASGEINAEEGGSEIDQSRAPEGYRYVRVSLGLNDDRYIEITGGLDEGDTILVPKLTAQSDSTKPGNSVFMTPGMPGAQVIQKGPGVEVIRGGPGVEGAPSGGQSSGRSSTAPTTKQGSGN